MLASVRRDRLVLAGIVFLVANLVHGADHMRQGTERLTNEVLGGGAVLTLLAVAMVALALAGHRRAPLFAAAIGLWSAVAISASHLAPHWSAFSDPYPDLSVDALSWAVLVAEIAAALVLGVVGARQLRAREPVAGGRARVIG